MIGGTMPIAHGIASTPRLPPHLTSEGLLQATSVPWLGGRRKNVDGVGLKSRRTRPQFRIQELSEILHEYGIHLPRGRTATDHRQFSGSAWRILLSLVGCVGMVMARVTGSARRVFRRPRLKVARHVVVRPDQLQSLLDKGVAVSEMDVEGDTSPVYETQQTLHPVLQALHERRRSGYVPGSESDGRRIALAIEGGGMRGCVPAAMAAALADQNIGLLDSFDRVYGSSAGAIAASYVVSRQLPEGLAVFYNELSAETGQGKDFVDMASVLQPLVGLGAKRPGLDLGVLLRILEDGPSALDFEKFLQNDERQPLGVVASSPELRESVVLCRSSGNFESFSELLDCLQASALVPGLCGMESVSLHSACKSADVPGFVDNAWNAFRNFFRSRKEGASGTSCQLIDALFYEPIPYRSALKDGCTHVLVLRSKKDGQSLRPHGGIVDMDLADVLYKRFAVKNGLQEMVEDLNDSEHWRIYFEDILKLNSECARFDDWSPSGMSLRRSHLGRFLLSRLGLRGRQPIPQRLMTLALHPEDQEVSALELRRSHLLKAMHLSYARAYAALSESPEERTLERGMQASFNMLPSQ